MVDRVRLGFAYSILKERPVKGTSSFSELLKAYIQKVDMEQHKADKIIEEFLSGKRDVHEVVLAVEKADISFRLFMKIKEKLVEAYQEIMRMQV
jgi:flagellar hook-basal body complex protein FliE